MKQKLDFEIEVPFWNRSSISKSKLDFEIKAPSSILKSKLHFQIEAPFSILKSKLDFEIEAPFSILKSKLDLWTYIKETLERMLSKLIVDKPVSYRGVDSSFFESFYDFKI